MTKCAKPVPVLSDRHFSLFVDEFGWGWDGYYTEKASGAFKKCIDEARKWDKAWVITFWIPWGDNQFFGRCIVAARSAIGSDLEFHYPNSYLAYYGAEKYEEMMVYLFSAKQQGGRQ